MDQDPPPVVARVAANLAKNGFFALLERVGRGEEVEITRHGMTVARLVPAGVGHGRRAAFAAVKTLAAMRDGLAARGVRMSQAEIRALREEGPR